MTDRELLLENNEKLKKIQETLKNKILAGGGSVGDGEYFVKVIDYDGTILKEANLNTGDTFTLPTPPSHDGLVFQEWSCSQDIVDGVITIEDNDVMAGAVYTTASGLNEFDIELTKVTGLDVPLNMDGTKDWGDGTSDDLKTHTYAGYGKYTIKCNGTTMTTSSSSGLFGANKCCIGARFAAITKIGTNAFRNCYSLKHITIPQGTTSVNDGAFQRCYSLTSITIPQGAKIVAQNVFESCYSATSIIIPKSVKNIDRGACANCFSLTHVVLPNNTVGVYGSAFAYCHSLKRIRMPQGVTTLGGAFSYCSSLETIVIPKGVLTINDYTFELCMVLKTYDFSTHTSVPYNAGSTVFTNINPLAKIIVPDNLYDEWITATNWVTYADYIYKASEV